MDVVVCFGLLAVVAHAQRGSTQSPSLASKLQKRANAPIDPSPGTTFRFDIFITVWHTCQKHQTRRKRTWQTKRVSPSVQNTLRSGIQNQKTAQSASDLLTSCPNLGTSCPNLGILVSASFVKVQFCTVNLTVLCLPFLNSSY